MLSLYMKIGISYRNIMLKADIFLQYHKHYRGTTNDFTLGK